MSAQKLNELAAQAMGWKFADESKSVSGCLRYERPGMDNLPTGDWNPCEDLNDASALLEKVAPAGTWYCNKNSTEVPERQYWAADSAKHEAYSSTEALAKTLCALRASGIPESSITEACT